MAHAGDFLIGLMALAGDEHDIVFARGANRALDGAAAIALDDDIIDTREASEDRRDDRIAVLATTMTRSARRSAIRAICGRLPASRSPPQPKTQTSAPVQCARRLVRACSSASGVCA